MKNSIRILALILIVALSITTLSACIYPGYLGEYPELCSVAWANLVDIRGFCSDGEWQGDPFVEVIETDSYGRILFSYSENFRRDIVYIMVMQSRDDTTASYYPEDCYYCVEVYQSDGKYSYDSEVIESLKLLNDWEKPINVDKCDKTEIVKRKPEGKVKNGDDDTFLEGVIKRYHECSGRYISPKNISFVGYSRFVTADDYGRELWTVYTEFEEYTEKMEIHYSYKFLIVVMPDGSCDESTVILLEDTLNAQNAVKHIKASNNWNNPI